jgi:hypothetical protein
MAVILCLVQLHLLAVVVAVLVGRVIMEAQEEEGVIPAVLVGLEHQVRVMLAVMVVLMVVAAVAVQVVLVVTPLAHKTEVMEVRVQPLLATLTLVEGVEVLPQRAVAHLAQVALVGALTAQEMPINMLEQLIRVVAVAVTLLDLMMAAMVVLVL